MTASANRLFSAMRGRTPCDDCRQRPNCAGKGLACRDYGHYIRTGDIRREERTPTRQRFENMMGAE